MRNYQYPELTLAEVQAAMEELIGAGTPNVKLAFWNASLSVRTPIKQNCAFARAMRAYAQRPLPLNRDELKAQLPGIMESQVRTLYEIEKLYGAGILHFNAGNTEELQRIWRSSMVSCIPGMGCKTVSFALHIYAPSACHILTIDCWHARRLGHRFGEVSEKNYSLYEEALRADVEALKSQKPGFWDVTYAAYFWELSRRSRNAGCRDGYPSHAGLSCYI
jgi:hypothetical protein